MLWFIGSFIVMLAIFHIFLSADIYHIKPQDICTVYAVAVELIELFSVVREDKLQRILLLVRVGHYAYCAIADRTFVPACDTALLVFKAAVGFKADPVALLYKLYFLLLYLSY